MAKSSKQNTKEKKQQQPVKKKREVQVVSCPSAFPISDRSSSSASSAATANRKRPRQQSPNGKSSSSSSDRGSKNDRSSSKFLDWHDTAKEIRNYGATAFVGKAKRNYEDEQYYQLTGRHKKKQKMPLPMVRGLKKAAAKREQRQREEAKAAGIVLPAQSKKQGKDSARDSAYRSYGPAPSVGFMKNGVLRVNDKKKRR